MALTKVTGSVIKDSVSLSGNVSIGGTLTYQDVTNIDSVGIITARDDVKLVTNNKKITFGSGSNLEIYSTGTDGVVNAASGDIKIQKGGSGLLTFKSTGSHFLADVLIADSIIHDGDTNTKIRFPAADTITAETAGSERLRIKSDGKIQLASATANTIHTSSDNSKIAIFAGSTDSVSNGGVIAVTGVNHSAGCFTDVSAGAGGYIKMRVGTSEKLRIDSSGNIGVGTNVASDSTGNCQAFKIARPLNGQVRLILQNSATGFGNGAGYHQGIDGSNIFIENRSNGGNIDFATFDSGGTYALRFRIDSDGVSGDVKNNFLLNEFKRTDTSSQHGALSTNFTTDNTINLTISNYQRGQRIIVRACVPCGIALNNSSGTNYAGTSVRVKVTGNTSGGATYSNDRSVWYRADGSGTHETNQNVFICVYINESDTTFSNGETLTITLEGKKNSGTGTSQHYLGGWSSVKEITSERYIREL